MLATFSVLTSALPWTGEAHDSGENSDVAILEFHVKWVCVSHALFLVGDPGLEPG